MPSASLPKLGSSDKVYHFIAFAGLAFLLAWSVPKRPTWLAHFGLVGGIALGYACLDELTQNFIPSRTCDVNDVIADAVGIAFGLVAYLALRQTLLQVNWGRTLIQALSR